MQKPLQITSRDFSLNTAVEREIREKAAKLEKYFQHIIGCRVIVEAPGMHRHTGQHQHKGGPFRVRIDLSVPGTELVADHQADKDLRVAIRNAFDAMRRQLEDHARLRRGATKTHEESPHGRVSTLFSQEGYGFIETTDKREIYFHRNSLARGSFDQLKVGMNVRFVEEPGEKGPQASTVTLIG